MEYSPTPSPSAFETEPAPGIAAKLYYNYRSGEFDLTFDNSKLPINVDKTPDGVWISWNADRDISCVQIPGVTIDDPGHDLAYLRRVTGEQVATLVRQAATNGEFIDNFTVIFTERELNELRPTWAELIDSTELANQA